MFSTHRRGSRRWFAVRLQRFVGRRIAHVGRWSQVQQERLRAAAGQFRPDQVLLICISSYFFFPRADCADHYAQSLKWAQICCASYDDTNFVFVALQPMSRSLTVSFIGFFQRPDAAHHWQHNDGVGAAQSRQVPRSAYRLHAGPGCWVPAGREPLLERGSTRLAVGQQEIRLSGLQSYQRGTVNLNQIICLLFVPRVVGVHSLFIKFRPKSLWKWI